MWKCSWLADFVDVSIITPTPTSPVTSFALQIEEDFMKAARKVSETKGLESKLDYSKV